MKRSFLTSLTRDLEAPIAARGFGTGWFSGFFALVFAVAGLCFVVALRWPEYFGMPELATVRGATSFRLAVHLTLITGYALALLSLSLRPRKALGATALTIALAATLLGGAGVQPREAHDWGIFFGVDFFALNMIATGLMFAPVGRLLPHRPDQRLFRTE
ncbi:hypothetical protein BH10PSE14_BH10PSE14_40690 [soil metagenome]